MVLPVLDLRLLFKMLEEKTTRNKNEILAINNLDETYLVLYCFLGNPSFLRFMISMTSLEKHYSIDTSQYFGKQK